MTDAPRIDDARNPSPWVLEMADVDVPGFEGEGPPQLLGVNWRVAAGAFHLVAGPPASGKSALLAAAAGLLRPERGQVRLFGEPLADLNEAALVSLRQRVGMVFADGGRLFHQLTVQENISLPLRYHRDCEESDVAQAVTRLLEVTGLKDCAHVTPGRLARHQRQRAGLARALALDPEFLLLDNPLAGLDPREIRWWLDLVRGLAQGHVLRGGRPMTIAVAADDPRPWAEPGRSCVVVDQGRVSEPCDLSGPPLSANPLLRELMGGG